MRAKEKWSDQELIRAQLNQTEQYLPQRMVNARGVRVIGIDPGLVHTGVVSFHFLEGAVRAVGHAVNGLNPDKIIEWLDNYGPSLKMQGVFIEAYRPRSHFDTDSRMSNGVQRIKAALPNSKIISNTGVTKVITRQTMELLDCWAFDTTTHHQDLRSAARIGLYGMVKDEVLNSVLFATIVAKLKEQGVDVI